ncbi:MAG: ribosome biogenesis GTPase YqeH [Lactovum sp.]
MTEELYCIGCGSLIQIENKKEAGYLPVSALNKKQEEEAVYCQRCFRLRHYNEITASSMTEEDFLQMLKKISKKNALIVNVVDIFDLTGSMIEKLPQYVGKNEILLVANKLDILPHSLKKHKLTTWIRKEAGNLGLNVKDVFVMSARRKADVEELLDLIDNYRKNRDVYVVGVTNVGKSTLINAMIKQVSGHSDLITTSRFPGTTLDWIEIPLDEKSKLIDTPGIIHKGQMAHYLNPEDLNLISPKKEIKAKTWQLNAGQTLFLAGLARVDFVSGERQGITTYFDNELMIHRTKLSGADEFYKKHAGELLTPNISKIFIKHEFKITRKSDLVISGLGWVRIAKEAEFIIWTSESIDVSIRESLI